jgi:hypothetical protein
MFTTHFHAPRWPKDYWRGIRHVLSTAALVLGVAVTGPLAAATAYVQGTYAQSCVVAST